MNKVTRLLILTVCAVLALAALSSCSTLSGNSAQTTSVSISGNGTIYLKADMVTFSINVNETKPTTAEAQQAANKKMTAILDILRKFGIEDDKISTTALNFSTEYYWDNGKQEKIGESVSQTVYVTMEDIDAFPQLSDELGTKLNGISFYNVRFDSSQKAKATEQARELAYADALKKAELYAKAAGLEVVRPVSISEGYASFSTANYRSADVVMMKTAGAATEASYDTQTPTGLLSAGVDVSVVFELK
ncbi:MAG: SIMPL domain-containing protein [Spirochaetales bacterium]|nr:SIMPL domain-containing protein [Spirochaetales bacterium]